MSPNVIELGPQGQFDRVEPMKSDLHHIFPAEIGSNTLRSSYDFGMVSNVDPMSPIAHLGAPAGGGAKVFQPPPGVRGDIARAHFYMVARYKFDSSIVQGEAALVFDDDDNLENGRIKDAEEVVLRAWHIADPVDDAERARSARVEAYQGNRNPFVDWPELVERVADY